MEESKLEKAIHESRADGVKRIALINPPSFFLTDDKVFSSLGLLNIAGVAIDAGHKVDLYDLAGRNNYGELAKEIGAKGYDVYGVTATSPQFSYAVNILNGIKEAHPQARVVVGGPHATMFASLRKRRLLSLGSEKKVYASDINFKSLEYFDQVIEGEELGIFEVLKSLKEQSPKKWVYAGVTDDLERIPFLPRHLIDMKSYLLKDDGKPKFEINGGPATSLISQRGCPFGCNFCSGRNVPQYRQIRNVETGTIRAFSPGRIVAEINAINQEFPNVTGFMFYDDELNLLPKTTLALMDALTQNNQRRSERGEMPYSFRGFVKSELLVKHPEVADAMKEAGFATLLSGFESGSRRILEDIVKKNTTPEINYAAAKILLERGIQVKALMMTGHPTETREDLKATERFLQRVGELGERTKTPWDFDLTILGPLPGSHVYDDAVPNQGRFSDKYERVLGDETLFMREVDFAKEVAPYKTAPGENVVNVRTKELSGQDLFEIRNDIDGKIRERFRLRTYDREDPRKDIEHTMGQQTK